MPLSGLHITSTDLLTGEFGLYPAPLPSSPSTDDRLDAMSWVYCRTHQLRECFALADTQLPKDNKMNEIMTALEAMIKRVVIETTVQQQLLQRYDYPLFMATLTSAALDNPEEFQALIKTVMPAATDAPAALTNEAFGTYLNNFVRTSPQVFDEIVKQATLDKPWFDDAVKSEVAEVLAETNQDMRLVSLVNEVLNAKDFVEDGRLEGMVNDQLTERDVVTKDVFDGLFNRAVTNTDMDDFDDRVRDIVREMDFSISADVSVG